MKIPGCRIGIDNRTPAGIPWSGNIDRHLGPPLLVKLTEEK
jgi:hypothetical protein